MCPERVHAAAAASLNAISLAGEPTTNLNWRYSLSGIDVILNADGTESDHRSAVQRLRKCSDIEEAERVGDTPLVKRRLLQVRCVARHDLRREYCSVSASLGHRSSCIRC